MNLTEILTGVEVAGMIGSLPPSFHIKGISCDSRDIREGWIFVAHRGKLRNGEDYIDDALRSGAAALVVEKENAVSGVCQIVVPNTRNAIAVMSSNFWGVPSRKLEMVGITGSNGKTTTSFMVDEILKAAAIPSGLLGTVYARTGKDVVPSVLTTPDSYVLQRYLADMVGSGFRACNMEVSSIAIHMRRVHGIDYRVFAFINISREHIDDHGDYETYYNLKASMVRGLQSDAVCVLNADQDDVWRLSKETEANVLSFSARKGAADCYIEQLDLSTGTADFQMSLCGEIIPVKLAVAGYHSVINALAAAAVCKAMALHGLPIRSEHIRIGLEHFRGVERRFECIYDREFKIFDDHFANPGNIAVTLETVHKMQFRAFALCYAVRGSRGTTVNRENVEAMLPHLQKLGVDSIVATASVETVTSKDMVTAAEKEVFLSCMKDAGIDVCWHDRLEDAVRAAADRMEDGGVLLLAGCQGMDRGGRYALEFLFEKTGDETVLEPLKKRVCGELPAELSEKKSENPIENSFAKSSVEASGENPPGGMRTVESLNLDADFERFLELCKISFGSGVTTDRRMYDWYFNQNPHNPSGGNMMYVMKEGDRIIAADGLIPFELRIRGKTYKSAHSVLSMTHPQFKKQGLFRRMTLHSLEKAKEHGLDAVLGLANRNSCDAYRKFGWTSLFEKHIYIRPVHIYTRLRRKIKCAFFAGIAAALYSAYDEIRRILLRRTLKPYAASVLDLVPPSAGLCFEAHKDKFPALIRRDFTYLNYRYNLRPDKKYKTVVIREYGKAASESSSADASIDGFAVVRVCPVGDHTMLTVSEFFCDPSDVSVVKALMYEVISYAYANAVEYMVVSVGGNPSFQSAFYSMGFRRNKKPLLNHQMIAVKIGDDLPDLDCLVGEENWMITQGDGESELHI